MSVVQLIDVDDPAWDEVVEQCSFHDAFHHADYHRAMAPHGRPVLLTSEDTTIPRWALALVLHPISEVLPGLEGYDAISVYGYTGLAWCPEHRKRYRWGDVWQGIRAALRGAGVVSVFIRWHPYDPFDGPWPDSSAVVTGGESVIVAGLLEQLQDAGYRKGHRYDIRRAERDGIHVVWSSSEDELIEFVPLYEATMARLRAREAYYFERTHLSRLFRSEHFATVAGKATIDDETLAMSLFLVHPPYSHYFLSASAESKYGSRPSKRVIHDARGQVARLGATTLHLGGGYGAERDSLLEFKSGFSNTMVRFRSLRWVVDQGQYAAALRSWSGSTESSVYIHRGWFPGYRARPSD